eukprot:m.272973 g.272973  ORF g.272973 m.272973 type:complete len:235 (-) comp11088_c1_seq38:319-1023(-)
MVAVRQSGRHKPQSQEILKMEEKQLREAAKGGNDTEVLQLLEGGTNVDCRCLFGGTPLQLAADEGHESTVGLLIAHGADMDCKDSEGWVPLHYAAHNGRKNVAELLLAHGADIHRKSKVRGSCSRNVQLACPLISMLPMKSGKTPLFFAVTNGQHSTIELLPVLHRQDGKTPLHFAVENGFTSAAELLVAHGADVNHKDNVRDTRLCWSVRAPELIECAAPAARLDTSTPSCQL